MTVVGILGVSAMCGMNCAQETLTSQAYGANELVRCGILLNRGRVILLMMLLPVSIIFYNMEALLLAFNFEPELAHYASQYAISQITGAFFYAQFDLSKRFLIQLQVSWAPMVA